MNFQDFYKNIEQRLLDSILSLWSTGDKETQEYLKTIFKDEKLLAEPVFQTTFPWEPAKEQLKNLEGLFSKEFIHALDKKGNGEYRFPKNRQPYKHQIQSWRQLLEQKNSVAVTTGTGSGKTECFMLPVLQDLHENCKDSTGVNALFLYPLNALIGSQKKRVHAWAKSLGGLRYAVYNGKTEEKVPYKNQQLAYPEVISRENIRQTPPQILFTNPTMLEYILVRNKDVDLLKNSQGKLRWILLDEAHTLTGSKATEMALLIRRVLDAFAVEAKDVRFAATSATVGSEADKILKEFVANLCGININNVTVIKGNRVAEELPKATIPKLNSDQLQKLSSNEIIRTAVVQKLRQRLLKEDALKLSDISTSLGLEKNLLQGLGMVDRLAEIQYNNNSLLPVRGHFFARGIGGVYVCTNPSCSKHNKTKAPNAPGSLTTIASNECEECGYPMLELVACRSCGNQLLYGEKYSDNGKHYFQMSSDVSHDVFELENEDDENEETPRITNTNRLQLAKRTVGKKYLDNCLEYGLSKENELLSQGNYLHSVNNQGQSVCPHCGSANENPMFFRLSASFLNRVLADIILEQTPEIKDKTEHVLWDGRKYISFADSRQGTAKISALINIDGERNWLQSEVFHTLCAKGWDNNENEFGTSDKTDIEEAIRTLEEELLSCPPILRRRKEKDLTELQEALTEDGGFDFDKTLMTWQELFDILKVKGELKTLFNKSESVKSTAKNPEEYLAALFFDQFSRRLPRERSIENLGLVSVVYPDLRKEKRPTIAKTLGISEDEWQSLLKISTDYIIRYYFHFFIDQSLYVLATSQTRTKVIYPSTSDRIRVKKWPVLDKKKGVISRLVLLICAGLGYTSLEEIDTKQEDDINELLEKLWMSIRGRLLTVDGEGYRLNLQDKLAFLTTH